MCKKETGAPINRYCSDLAGIILIVSSEGGEGAEDRREIENQSRNINVSKLF